MLSGTATSNLWYECSKVTVRTLSNLKLAMHYLSSNKKSTDFAFKSFSKTDLVRDSRSDKLSAYKTSQIALLAFWNYSSANSAGIYRCF